MMRLIAAGAANRTPGEALYPIDGHWSAPGDVSGTASSLYRRIRGELSRRVRLRFPYLANGPIGQKSSTSRACGTPGAVKRANLPKRESNENGRVIPAEPFAFALPTPVLYPEIHTALLPFPDGGPDL